MSEEADRQNEASHLQDFIYRASLVTVQSLHAWREEDPNARLETHLARNISSINESRWLNAIAEIPDAPPVYPVTPKFGVCATAALPVAEGLYREHFAVIVADDPVLIIGVLNPWSKNAALRYAARHLGERPSAAVCLSPHSYAAFVTMIARKQVIQDFSWESESLPEWCGLLGFDAESFSSVSALVEDLWLRDPTYPVILPYSFEQTKSVLSNSFAFVVRATDTVVWVAMTEPTNEALIDELYQQMRGRAIRPLAISPGEARRLSDAFDRQTDDVVDTEPHQPLVVRDWHGEAGREAELWTRILENAIRMGSSDIYLDPKPDRIRVRFGIDGSCVEQAPITRGLYDQLLVRLKIKGNMDHTEIGRIQNGSGFHVVNGIRYDQRYSALVLRESEEKVVVRIFSSSLSSLQQLALPDRERNALMWFLDQNDGMMIVTGPTGSGKTTTLYGCLNYLNSPKRSILTIEDPVEKYVEDINQVEVKPSKGITFENALNAALRQAPHVIMIGEIRSQESAEIAVQAALTGHLVLTTLHTLDAAAAIERFVTSFKIDKVTMANCVKLILAQRLVPRLCPACKRVRDARPEDLRPFPSMDIASPQLAEPVGCPSCRGTGFAGRLPILEALPIDPPIIHMLEQHEATTRIRQFNEERGFTTLAKQATRLVLNGEITIETAKRYLSSPML